jgi:hypothetical protein
MNELKVRVVACLRVYTRRVGWLTMNSVTHCRYGKDYACAPISLPEPTSVTTLHNQNVEVGLGVGGRRGGGGGRSALTNAIHVQPATPPSRCTLLAPDTPTGRWPCAEPGCYTHLPSCTVHAPPSLRISRISHHWLEDLSASIPNVCVKQ